MRDQGQARPWRLLFYHNGQTTTPVASLPQGTEEYGTYSVYHDESVFWTVDYDACKERVQNGREEDSGDEANNDQSDSEDEEEDERDTWSPLKFKQVDNNECFRMSFAGRRLEHRRLRAQRPDQLWATQLLPDGYQARPEDNTQNPRCGGLVGDLPLLLALMTMSVPYQHIASCLPQMIVNLPNTRGSWRVFPPAQVLRRSGCKSWASGRKVTRCTDRGQGLTSVGWSSRSTMILASRKPRS